MDMALDLIATELRKITEAIKELDSTINTKLGGLDTNNLNVTLFTDDPIEIKQAKEEK